MFLIKAGEKMFFKMGGGEAIYTHKVYQETGMESEMESNINLKSTDFIPL